MNDDPKSHWESVYAEKSDGDVSWHQDVPSVSLEFADAAGVDASSVIIDVGGGTSRFAECLLDRGFKDVTVLDVSEPALAAARARLGPREADVRRIVADVTVWSPDRHYDLWHDRAVFHFMTVPGDRPAYVDRLSNALRPNGRAIISTFAPDGPERCSGLPVMRYSPKTLAEALGPRFELIANRRHLHVTPWGTQQSFQFSLFCRK